MANAYPESTLPAEQTLIASLLELMKQEQGLLVDADADGLAALIPQKTRYVQQLAALAAERHRALAGAGFAASESGMEPWLSSQAGPAARSQWENLLASTAEAKELNRVNGMLINKQMAHTQTALNALRVPAAGGADAGVYGPSGQTVATGPSRRFVLG